MFNLTDFIGRSLAGWKQFIPPKWLWLATSVRVVFFPLFLLCRLDGATGTPVFASDAWPLLFTALLGVSNGCVVAREGGRVCGWV